MSRYSSYFEPSNKYRLSINESIRNSDNTVKQLIKEDSGFTISPIIREQQRRSSLSNSSFTRRQSESYPSGVYFPNSVLRKSYSGSKEYQPTEEKQKRLSNKELEDKVSNFMQQILNRLKHENVVSNEADLQKDTIHHSILTPKMRLDELRRQSKKKKKIVDKDKEMNRIIRRTSLITPFHEGKRSTSEAIREAIEKSEKKYNLLVQPEELILKHSHVDAEKAPAELTSSWIRRVSDSLAVSARRISELTEKIEANKYERPKENDSGLQVQVNSAPNTPRKKDNKPSPIKKKSSLKLSKLGSSSYVHPTIIEVDEERPTRTESRQTQLSYSSSTRASVRSSGSLKRRSSSASDNMRRVNSGNNRTSIKDLGKQLSSTSKEKSKVSTSSKSSLITKETEENLSRKSSASQKSSNSEKHLPGSSSSKYRKPSLKSIGSKQKVDGQVSKTSSKPRSATSDSSDTMSVLDDTNDRASLSSLIDLYYASPNRKSTTTGLDMYMKKIFSNKDNKPQIKQKKPENKSENLIRFSGVEDQPSDTDESFIIKRDEDETDDEASQLDKKELPETKDETNEKDNIETKQTVEKTYSENFDNLMSKVTNEIKAYKNSSGSVAMTKNKNQLQKRRTSITGKKLSSERKLENKLEGKTRGSIQTKRNSKEKQSNKKTDENLKSSLPVKSNSIKLKEKRMSPPVLEKRKTLDSDQETIKYLTGKKIISLSKMKEVKMNSKSIKEQSGNEILDINTQQIEAV